MKKYTLLLLMIVFIFPSISFAATYYMRADGTAANKAAASGPCGTQANCMSIATHDGETFSAGDTIILCDDGGVYRDQMDIPSSGSSGSPITYQNASGDSPVISGSSIISTWAEVGGAAETGDLLEESYEVNPGTDESWSGPTVGSGSTFDVDNTDVARPDGGGDELLKIQKVSPNFASWDTIDLGSENAIVYIRMFVRIAAEGLGSNNTLQLWQGRDSGGGNISKMMLKQTAGGSLVFLGAYDDNGDPFTNTSNSSSIVVDTWYKIEFKWDKTGTAWEFKLDGVVQDSGSLTGTLLNGVQHFRVGSSSDSYTVTLYIDRVAIDSSNYLAESGVNKWATTLGATVPNQVFFDGTKGVEAGGYSAMDTDQEWYYCDGCIDATDDTLYQYSATDPDTRYTSPGTEVSQRDGNIVGDGNLDYITIDGLTLQHGDQDGVRIREGADNWIVQNSTITYNANYGVLITGSTTAAGSNVIQDNTINYNGETGITCGVYCETATIRRNTIHNNGNDPTIENQSGIKLFGSQGTTNNNNVVEFNKIYSNGTGGDGASGVGIWIDQVQTTDGNGNILRYNFVYDNNSPGIYIEKSDYQIALGNIIFDNNLDSNGISGELQIIGANSQSADGNKLYNNTIEGAGERGIQVRTQTSGTANNNIIKNNIVFNSTDAALHAEGGGANNTTDGTGNVYNANAWGVEATGFIYWDASKDTYDAFISTSSQTDNNIETDPLFTNAGADDFTLQNASPAIDTGVDLGVTYDDALHHNSIWPNNVNILDQDNYGSGWEIGAYVFYSFIPKIRWH